MRKLFEGDFYGAGDFIATHDVSPDGRHFLMARRIGTGEGGGRGASRNERVLAASVVNG